MLGENFQSVPLVDLDGTGAFEIDLVESCFLVDRWEFNYFLLCFGFLHRYIYILQECLTTWDVPKKWWRTGSSSTISLIS